MPLSLRSDSESISTNRASDRTDVCVASVVALLEQRAEGAVRFDHVRERSEKRDEVGRLVKAMDESGEASRGLARVERRR